MKQARAGIEQPLHHAAFGLTFVALDPDGYRLRVCLPCPASLIPAAAWRYVVA
ncbi:hypothetical protein PF66_02306 [Pseudomonas asplenii]|uniref:Uncharacterized protein n=1 Tax=Pseudomonas asplenii TaxID=53407 RepID=A0A0M9GHY0_9PSED|nr:hypothetical protein [Pseudomonas fuscovaginae]KPA91423.1 hypothetical protein PF66_02306 [Pseudomonas fuscovaginae]